MAQIHPSSIVHPDAELADDVVVGPFCLIGPKVRIGAGTHLRSHVCVEGRHDDRRRQRDLRGRFDRV